MKVNLHKFMDRFMDVRDDYFMFHCYSVKVVYKDYEIIDELIRDNDYSKHLDQLGQNGAILAAALSDCLADEKEIRMIYSYMPENEFVASMVKVHNGICRVPFDWSSLLEEILVSPTVSDEILKELDAKFRDLGVACDIRRSQLNC